VSLSAQTMLELMALADGELEGADKERAERLVAQSAEARRIVEGLRAPAVGAWLAESMDARAAAAGADGIADAVMARLQRDAKGASSDLDGGGVVRITDAKGGRRASRVQVVAAVAGAALALAAGIAFYVRSDSPRDELRAPVASVGGPSVDVQPPPAARSAVAQGGTTPSHGVEVDEIDSPSRGVSVFEIPMGAAAANASAPSSVVIWIEDDPK